MTADLWLVTLGLMTILTLAVLLVPVAERIGLPHTVLLAAAGILLGIANLASSSLTGPAGDLLLALDSLDITSELVLFIFLPALVFESALSLDPRRLAEDLTPILTLAVAGLIISTIAVGVSMWGISGMTLTACLLLGAIVSATDPVAVVAIFKDLGAPKRLATLVEGESLMNDATAIVAFTILSGMLMGTTTPGVLSGVFTFTKVFLGGVIVGYLFGRALCFLVTRVGEKPLPRIALTVTVPYLAFITAEHYLHLSGVMAVVTAGLVMGSVGRTVIVPARWHDLELVWEQIGFVANSVIFVLVGMAVPGLLKTMGGEDLVWMAVLLGSAFAARFAIIFGLIPMLTRLRLATPVAVGYRVIMFWGGLRGAVSLALALAILENPAIDVEVRQFVAVLVTAFVLFTLFINATTIKPVMRLVGLDRFSPVDVVLQQRAVSTTREKVRRRLKDVSGAHRMAPEIMDDVIERLHDEPATAMATELERSDWLRVALRTAVVREHHVYRRLLDEALVPADVARILFRHAGELLDAVKADDPVQAYRDAGSRTVAFGKSVHAAAWAQRTLGLTRPLAAQLARRFEVQMSHCLALREILERAASDSFIAEDIESEVHQELRRRLKDHEAALRSMRAAYPTYARKLERELLQRAALRLEDAHYRTMLDVGALNQDIFKDLHGRISHQRDAIEHPTLDLGLEPRTLVAKVPFFEGLDDERQSHIARVLRSYLALPGEVVVRSGERGDAMYFISSGAVRVEVPSGPVTLGRGDFFGEMALLSSDPRVADVVSEGFAELLVLYARDFERLMNEDPELRSTVEDVAASRGV